MKGRKRSGVVVLLLLIADRGRNRGFWGFGVLYGGAGRAVGGIRIGLGNV